MFYLNFSKTKTLTCSRFVYYSWKSLFLQNILKYAEGQTCSLKTNTDLWYKTTIPAFEPFFQKKEIYQYVNISWQKRTPFLRTSPSGCFLQGLLLIQSIAQILVAPILKNICKRLLQKICCKTEKIKIYSFFST